MLLPRKGLCPSRNMPFPFIPFHPLPPPSLPPPSPLPPSPFHPLPHPPSPSILCHLLFFYHFRCWFFPVYVLYSSVPEIITVFTRSSVLFCHIRSSVDQSYSVIFSSPWSSPILSYSVLRGSVLFCHIQFPVFQSYILSYSVLFC
jgi:hypothetical protein